MSEPTFVPDMGTDITTALQQRAERLEHEIAEVRREAEIRLIKAELRSEALYAGMIDLDGLKLVDTSTLTFDGDGTIVGAAALMRNFKKIKPWLFGGVSSSNPTIPPIAQPSQAKLATEMTDSEYKAARAALLRQRN
jgi:hypothetical protein